jgi:hypothetical protein
MRFPDILTHILPLIFRTSGLTCCRSFSGQHKSHFGPPLEGDRWDWPRCSQPDGRVPLSGRSPDSSLRPKAWLIPAQGNALGSSCHVYSVAGQRPASSFRPKAWFIPAQGNALGSSCHVYSVAGQRPASSLMGSDGSTQAAFFMPQTTSPARGGRQKMNRAFSAQKGFGPMNPGRCPGLV